MAAHLARHETPGAQGAARQHGVAAALGNWPWREVCPIVDGNYATGRNSLPIDLPLIRRCDEEPMSAPNKEYDPVEVSALDPAVLDAAQQAAVARSRLRVILDELEGSSYRAFRRSFRARVGQP